MESEQTADAGLGGTDAPAAGSAGAYTLDIDKDGTTAKVTVTGDSTATAPIEDGDFVLAMDFMDGRTMHTRTHKADEDGNVVTEVVIVAEDRDEPTPVEFAKFKDSTGGTPQALNVNTDTTNDSPAVTNEALDLPPNLSSPKVSGLGLRSTRDRAANSKGVSPWRLVCGLLAL